MRFKLQRSKSTTQGFYFEIQAAGNYETLATSETYVAKSDALHAINLIKAGAAGATVVDETYTDGELSPRLPLWRPDSLATGDGNMQVKLGPQGRHDHARHQRRHVADRPTTTASTWTPASRPGNLEWRTGQTRPVTVGRSRWPS